MAQPTTIKTGDPRNDIVPSAPRGFSKFDLSHRFLQTHRFGEISPHESFETVKGAKDSVRLMCDTSSYSLKAPLKTDIFQKRCNFFVPLQAIIRNNWELITAQPVSGDDVPEDADGVVTAATLNAWLTHLVDCITIVEGHYDDDPGSFVDIGFYLTRLLRACLVGEMFFSQGSLLKQLYFDFSHCVSCTSGNGASLNRKVRSFDAFLEQVLSAIAPVSRSDFGIHQFTVLFHDLDGSLADVYNVVSDEYLSENPMHGISEYTQMIGYRHFLDLCRQNLNFTIMGVRRSAGLDMDINESELGGYNVGLTEGLLNHLFGDFLTPANIPSLEFLVPLTENLNFNKVAAYQICCAHFFSLDHVDYIYSAELYRQLMQYYADQFFKGTASELEWLLFDYNGIQLRYDALSGHVITEVLSSAFSYLQIFPDSEPLSYLPRWSYLTAFFSFRHSLRYLDYFTGGRTRPLSVGSTTDPRANINVAVNNGAVNGVEMILAQNAARYLNFAQRAGRKISQWLDKLFPGGVPKPDMHDPQWLSATGDALNPEQTQNTGASQMSDANSITARFKNDSNNYMFTIHPDRPGYVICVTYYDIPRSYAFATHRENMHCNRYDRFNPFMQYNGSQPVSKQEIGILGDTPFSYQGRYEEYKQNYDIVSGGFVENLPGFAFIADMQSGLPMQPNLNPSYIRSWNCELDPFYLSLTGYGLAGYFHFIVKNVNIINSVRPMEYAPQLM